MRTPPLCILTIYNMRAILSLWYPYILPEALDNPFSRGYNKYDNDYHF